MWILIETESDIDNVWNRWRGTCTIPIYQVQPCLVIPACMHEYVYAYKLDVESRKLRALESRRGPGL